MGALGSFLGSPGNPFSLHPPFLGEVLRDRSWPTKSLCSLMYRGCLGRRAGDALSGLSRLKGRGEKRRGLTFQFVSPGETIYTI